VTARVKSLYAVFQGLLHEIAKFGVVGAVNYVLDVGVFNLLLSQGLHGKPLTAKTISTVDNVGTPQGRIVTALALAEQLAGRVGPYGTSSGALLLPKASQ